MKIVVIGAGIAGLTFAAAMQRFSPQTAVELYERDEGLVSHLQGYSLGLKGQCRLSRRQHVHTDVQSQSARASDKTLLKTHIGRFRTPGH